MEANKTARIGLMAALSIIFGYVESLLPAPGINGIKLGLANTVILYAIYLTDMKSTVLLAFIKVLITNLLFGSAVSIMYSAAGTAVSLISMYLLKKSGRFSVMGVSAVGAVGHNAGQLLVAALLVNGRAAMAYAPVLAISGCICGFITGLICRTVTEHLEKSSNKTDKSAH